MNIFKKVKSLKLPKNKYVVIAGSALQGYGIRKSNDIDILVTKDVYNQFKNEKGWKEISKPSGMKVLQKDVFDIAYNCSYGSYKTPTNKIIKEAQLIKGVAFIKLEELLKQKLAWNREKDQKDIQKIKDCLANRNSFNK